MLFRSKKMRTKALLGLAALAVSVATVVAQSNVYSLNVVGYVNVDVPAGYSILANPLKAGVTNGANEIMTPIDGQQILTWNGAGFDYIAYDSLFGGWSDVTGAPKAPPSLPPGKGFFFFNPNTTASKVTFVGEVVPAPGTTNSLALAPGYSMIGSALPVSGASVTAAPLNLPVIDGMQILTWNGNGYTYRAYDSLFGGWVDVANNPAAAPSYSVGQGFFFYNPNTTASSWSQSLP